MHLSPFAFIAAGKAVSHIRWGCLLACLVLSGCSPNLARRYRNWPGNNTKKTFIWAADVDVPTYASVDLGSYAIEPVAAASAPASPSLLSLAGEGQAAFIKALDARVSPGPANLKELVTQITDAFPDGNPPLPKVKVISKTLKKSLVFTVERSRFRTTGPNVGFSQMADRLAYLELSVDMALGSPLRFNSWDRFVTKEATIDLGQVTSGHEWNASLTGNVGSTNVVSASNGGEQAQTLVPATTLVADDAASTTATKATTGSSRTSTLGLGVAGTAGVTNKYSTALSLTNRILALSGKLQPQAITLIQEGAQGIDLSGNQALSVEYTTTAEWATPIWVNRLPARLYSAPNVPLAATGLKLPGFHVVFPDVPPVLLADGNPNPAASFTGWLRYRFLYRKVLKGNRHLPDARHRVQYVLGQAGYGPNTSAKPADPLVASIITNGKVQVLAQSSDYRPRTYRLSYVVPGSNPPDGHFVTLSGQPVQFETVQEALTFLQYLHDVAATPAGAAVPGLAIASLAVTVTSASIPAIKVVSFQN